MVTVKEVLYRTAFRKIDIEYLLDPGSDSWVRFDPVLGYVPDSTVMQDGMDASKSTYTFESSGQRKVINCADRPCRINSYGNSYTLCQQVSDGETWQEYLAAHIGEPIRNFGNGGYGVNQAYLRALRVEETDCSAEYIILGVYDDDHIRSLDAARWPRTQWRRRDRPITRATPMHGLPWAHVRFDLDKRCFVDVPGLCRTEDDLRALCDPDRYYEALKDDQIVRLFVLRLGGEVDDVDDLQALAEVFGLEADLRSPDRRAEDAALLHLTYGLRSTEYLLDKLRGRLEARDKKLMVVLFYSPDIVGRFITDKQRFDRSFIEYLDGSGVPYVDLAAKHAADYEAFGVSLDDYASRYQVHAAGAAVFGHYSPPGNFFAAMSMKDEIVNWLSPKPPAYRE